jgi:hypothetical protein
MKETFKEIAVLIRIFGFKGSGQNFYRIGSDVVLVINLQKSSDSNRFYINIGVQPLILLGENNDPKKVKEYECMFRERINPPEGELGWGYGLTDLDINEFKTKLEQTNEKYFNLLGNIRESIETMSINELLPEQDAPTIFGGYHAVTFKEFSVLANAYGLLNKAILFAQSGIKICKPTVKGLLANLTKLASS